MKASLRFGWFGWFNEAATCAYCLTRIRRWPVAAWTRQDQRVHLRCARKWGR